MHTKKKQLKPKLQNLSWLLYNEIQTQLLIL